MPTEKSPSAVPTKLPDELHTELVLRPPDRRGWIRGLWTDRLLSRQLTEHLRSPVATQVATRAARRWGLHGLPPDRSLVDLVQASPRIGLRTYLVQTGSVATAHGPPSTVFAARLPFGPWHWALFPGPPRGCLFADFLRRLHRDVGETILVICPQPDLLIDDCSRAWLDRYPGRVRIAWPTPSL